MTLICKTCGKQYYLCEQDPIPNLCDLSCELCNGALDYADEDLDDDALDEEPYPPMSS